MKLVGLVAPLVLLGQAPAAAGLTLRRSATGSPVEKVVKLLEGLKERLGTDQKEEQKVYDKFACWCEKTTARKAATIEGATQDLRSFGQTILSLKGNAATLTHEIELLEAQIRSGNAEVEQATAIRQKENAAFVSETTEMKQAIAAMEKAIKVLSAAGSSLLQTEAKDKVKDVVRQLPVSKSIKVEQLSLLSEYMNAGYAPQSMTVQGILKDMYETFAQDLESATQAEAKANTNFEGLVATKTAEIKTMEKAKGAKEAQKAETEQRLADTQAMFDDTAEQKKADVAFFDETKVSCAAKHAEWTARSKLRTEEVAGIDQALKILTSDSARELFASSIKAGKETGASDKYDTGRDLSPSFLQMSSSVANAYETLKASAGAGHSLRLARLASQVRTVKVGHFDEVLKAIDAMLKTLADEDASDIAKRDQCKAEYHKIQKTLQELNWSIEKNNAKITKLTKLIEARTAQLERTTKDIADVDTHMKTLTATRTAENEAFLKAKEEDQKAIDLLKAAREAFANFYKKNGIDMGPVQGSVKGAFAQEPEFAVSKDQAPDADFSHKGHRKNESKGIISIMTMLLEDLNDEIKNGMKSEEASQVEYQKQMDIAKKLKEELVAKKVSLETAISKRTADRADEMEDKDTNKRNLDDEVAYKKSITPDCDWIIGAFDKRAKTREAERNGLAGAKDFLAGAKP